MIVSEDKPPRKVRYNNSAPRFQFQIWSIPFINRLWKRFPLTGAGTHVRTGAPEGAAPSGKLPSPQTLGAKRSRRKAP